MALDIKKFVESLPKPQMVGETRLHVFPEDSLMQMLERIYMSGQADGRISLVQNLMARLKSDVDALQKSILDDSDRKESN